MIELNEQQIAAAFFKSFAMTRLNNPQLRTYNPQLIPIAIGTDNYQPLIPKKPINYIKIKINGHYLVIVCTKMN